VENVRLWTCFILTLGQLLQWLRSNPPNLTCPSLLSSSSLLSSEEEWYELWVSVLVLEALVDVSSWASICRAAARTGSCALRWLSILCLSAAWIVSCRYRGSEADVWCVGAARVERWAVDGGFWPVHWASSKRDHQRCVVCVASPQHNYGKL
jgi:hypothetical protein